MNDALESLARAEDKTEGQNSLINKLAKDLCTKEPGSLMTFQNAPDNAVTRYGLLTLQGVENIPRGVANSLAHNIQNPLKVAETLGTAAGMALVLKTVLPEGGLAGKVAGAAIGIYFTYKAAEPVVDAYKKAGNAKTLQELDLASKQFGDAGGSFIVDSAIAAVGYKIGSNLTDRVLSSRSMDGFADAKAGFYNKLSQVGTKITDNMGITAGRQSSIANILPEGEGKASRVRLADSNRNAPEGTVKGPVDPNIDMDVTVMLKSKGSQLRMDRTLKRIAQGRQAPLSEAEFANQFAAKAESLAAVTKFAEEYGLKVSEANLSSGRVVLNGKASQFSTAFETKLSHYENSAGLEFRAREGSLSIPGELAAHISSVLGTDNRPQLRSYIKFLETKENPLPGDLPAEPVDPRARKAGYMPNEVADAYNFPKGKTGEGQAVAIIELGGGLDKIENSNYYKNNGLPEPKIQVIEVSGAKSKPGWDSRADAEVHLDSQIIGAVAPKATQNLIFAPNSEKGFIDAITRATFPEKGEMQSSAISISWGAAEEFWTKQAMNDMSIAFKKAALKGLSVFAASGDDGALNNSRSGRWQVDFPASEPTVTGTGGTTLQIKDGKIVTEVAWNNNRPNDATGGGISEVFPAQEFQRNANVPPNANRGGGSGRGVPDVTGNGDPASGFRIRTVDGSDIVTAGTSAVAPLYSALTMRLNESLGKPVGSLNPWLYRNTGIFNDILSGHNNGYKTGPGWDPVSGLGSIDGGKMLAALKQNPNTPVNFGEFRFIGPSQISAPAPISGNQFSGQLENGK